MLGKSSFFRWPGRKSVMIDVICHNIPHNDTNSHTNPYASIGNYDKLHEVLKESVWVHQSP